MIGGDFTTLGGGGTGTTARNKLGRLNANGTLDTSFDPGANLAVLALAIAADGKAFAGGNFTTLGGGGTGLTTRNSIGRLTNTDAALQTLTVATDGTTITWYRGGASPEIDRATFQLSTDGTTYTELATPTRIPGGWQLTGQACLRSKTFSFAHAAFIRLVNPMARARSFSPCATPSSRRPRPSKELANGEVAISRPHLFRLAWATWCRHARACHAPLERSRQPGLRTRLKARPRSLGELRYRVCRSPCSSATNFSFPPSFSCARRVMGKFATVEHRRQHARRMRYPRERAKLPGLNALSDNANAFFVPEEETPGRGTQVAIVSHNSWKKKD